jgi:IS5 family transposase
MRQESNPRKNLFSPMANNSTMKELEQIFMVLDATPPAMDLVFQNIIKTRRHGTGRE